MSTIRPKTKAVTFHLNAPSARAVALAGEFNGWEPTANPLRRRKDGVWWVTVRLIPGSYGYKFVVDGSRWLEDPENPQRVLNEYGTFNSVCQIV